MMTLTRELILNCRLVGGEIFKYSTFASCNNQIRDIEGYISKRRLHNQHEEKVLKDLHSLVHYQFPLNYSGFNIPSLLRYARIFGSEKIDLILTRSTGLSLPEFFFFSIHIAGGLMHSPYVMATQDLSEFGIDAEKGKHFFSKMSRSVQNLREQLRAEQKYDDNWQYTYNALSGTPFVWLDDTHPEQLYCPIPSLLWHRIGPGLFYDLSNEPHFGNAYGVAFEEHVGEFLHAVLPADKFEIIAETEYKLGKKFLKHGMDWIVNDKGATLFIECKAKRMRLEAKMLDSEVALDDQLSM
ncbi:MAG: hypothetical protein V4754_12300 [Pseudomonadota bacterium]